MQDEASGSPGPEADFGLNSPELLARWDPATLSWKTSELSLHGESIKFSGPWPTSGTMQNGRLSRRPPWAPRISENASSSWPTPRANDLEKRGDFNAADPRNGLPGATKAWATPRAEDGERGYHSTYDGLMEDAIRWATPAASSGHTPERHKARKVKAGMKPTVTDLQSQALEFCLTHGPTPSLSEVTTARCDSSPQASQRRALNPRFVLWLVGFPVGWLDSAHWAMRSFRSAQRLSGGDSSR